jgi:hypothetical protein
VLGSVITLVCLDQMMADVPVQPRREARPLQERCQLELHRLEDKVSHYLLFCAAFFARTSWARKLTIFLIKFSGIGSSIGN